MRESRVAPHPHGLLLMGLLAGVIAHFVEMSFGIAIASTRTTFWAYAALLVVLGLRWVPGLDSAESVPAPQDLPGSASLTRGRSTRPARARRRGPTDRALRALADRGSGAGSAGDISAGHGGV